MSFWKEVFSEDDGQGSWSRVSSGVALVAVIGWITHIVMKTHALPDFSGSTLFVSAPYSANRAAEVTKHIATMFGKNGAPDGGSSQSSNGQQEKVGQ